MIEETKTNHRVDAIQGAGNPHVEFTLYPGVGHNAWTQTYANPDFYDWLLRHTRAK